MNVVDVAPPNQGAWDAQAPGRRLSWLAGRVRLVTPWQVWLLWSVTRLATLAAAIIGQHYCDPQFYHFAGQFAAGQLPYRDFSVERSGAPAKSRQNLGALSDLIARPESSDGYVEFLLSHSRGASSCR